MKIAIVVAIVVQITRVDLTTLEENARNIVDVQAMRVIHALRQQATVDEANI